MATMELTTVWKDGLAFTASGRGHALAMDAKKPLGRDTAMTPKELVVAGLCGCTGMDVAAYLRKHKAVPESLEVLASVTSSEGPPPTVFTAIALTFRVKGPVDAATLVEAVRLSQTRDCGVSAMLAKAVPIRYTIELDGKVVGQGEARF